MNRRRMRQGNARRNTASGLRGLRCLVASALALLQSGTIAAGEISRPRLEEGRIVLDSDLVLKSYVWAFGTAPIDANAILTRNTEDISPPPPAQPTPEQRVVLEQIAKDLRTHPQLVIHADDIAFEPSPGHPGAFDITNRLFVETARYYFDNSRYHYLFRSAGSLRTWEPPSREVAAALARSVTAYDHFRMDIAARVVRADPAELSLELAIERVDLRSANGRLLWSRPVAGAATHN